MQENHLESSESAKRVGVDEKLINFRPSPNFKNMKKFFRQRMMPPPEATVTSEVEPVAPAVPEPPPPIHPPLPRDPPPPDTPEPLLVPKTEREETYPFYNDEQFTEYYNLIPQEDIKTDEPEEKRTKTVCKDFIRGSCMRQNCRFVHENSAPYRLGVYKFCKKFQNGVCDLDVCRYVHADTFQEAHYYRTGILPPNALAHIKTNLPKPPQTPSNYPPQTPSNYSPQTQPNYPPQPPPNYPPQTPNYPPQTPNYPPQTPNYPPQTPNYPQQTPNYPPQPPSNYSSQQTPNYPPQPPPNYPPQPPSNFSPQQTPNYPPQFNQGYFQDPMQPSCSRSLTMTPYPSMMNTLEQQMPYQMSYIPQANPSPMLSNVNIISNENLSMNMNWMASTLSALQQQIEKYACTNCDYTKYRYQNTKQVVEERTRYVESIQHRLDDLNHQTRTMNLVFLFLLRSQSTQYEHRMNVDPQHESLQQPGPSRMPQYY